MQPLSAGTGLRADSGALGRVHSGVEPERDPGVTQIVRPLGRARSALSTGQGVFPGPRPWDAVGGSVHVVASLLRRDGNRPRRACRATLERVHLVHLTVVGPLLAGRDDPAREVKHPPSRLRQVALLDPKVDDLSRPHSREVHATEECFKMRTPPPAGERRPRATEAPGPDGERRPAALRAAFLPVAGLVGLVGYGAADAASQVGAVLAGSVRLVRANPPGPGAWPARPQPGNPDTAQDGRELREVAPLPRRDDDRHGLLPLRHSQVQVLGVRLGMEGGEDPLPDAVPLPATEQVVRPAPWPVLGRQVPPRAASTDPEAYAVDQLPPTKCRRPTGRLTLRQ